MTPSPIGPRGRLLALLAAPLLAALAGCASGANHDSLAARPGPVAQPACAPLTAYAKADPKAAPAEGCWNAYNLAKMVADPKDLEQGKPLGPADGARQAAAVEAYERGQPRAAAATDSSSVQRGSLIGDLLGGSNR